MFSLRERACTRPDGFVIELTHLFCSLFAWLCTPHLGAVAPQEAAAYHPPWALRLKPAGGSPSPVPDSHPWRPEQCPASSEFFVFSWLRMTRLSSTPFTPA